MRAGKVSEAGPLKRGWRRRRMKPLTAPVFASARLLKVQQKGRVWQGVRQSMQRKADRLVVGHPRTEAEAEMVSKAGVVGVRTEGLVLPMTVMG